MARLHPHGMVFLNLYPVPAQKVTSLMASERWKETSQCAKKKKLKKKAEEIIRVIRKFIAAVETFFFTTHFFPVSDDSAESFSHEKFISCHQRF